MLNPVRSVSNTNTRKSPMTFVLLNSPEGRHVDGSHVLRTVVYDDESREPVDFALVDDDVASPNAPHLPPVPPASEPDEPTEARYEQPLTDNSPPPVRRTEPEGIPSKIDEPAQDKPRYKRPLIENSPPPARRTEPESAATEATRSNHHARIGVPETSPRHQKPTMQSPTKWPRCLGYGPLKQDEDCEECECRAFCGSPYGLTSGIRSKRIAAQRRFNHFFAEAHRAIYRCKAPNLYAHNDLAVRVQVNCLRDEIEPELFLLYVLLYQYEQDPEEKFALQRVLHDWDSSFKVRRLIRKKHDCFDAETICAFFGHHPLIDQVLSLLQPDEDTVDDDTHSSAEGSKKKHVFARSVNPERRSALMQWLTRQGPFWEDVQTHGPTEWLEYAGEFVMNSSIGEAAWCCLNGVDYGVVSVIPSHWQFTPILVNSIRDDGATTQIGLRNYWDEAIVERDLKAAPPRLDSWVKLEETASARCNRLSFTPNTFQPLKGVPFVYSAACRLLFLLETLNKFKGCFDVNGHRTVEGHKIYQDFFTGKKGRGGRGAMFSDSSTKEKSDFESEMTFKHPSNPKLTLFCTYHGKVQTPQMRVHFTWPITSSEPLYVPYVGPKITKG